MTSTPVTASTRAFFTGPVTAGTSAGTGVENSFSDVLKNQKNDGQTGGTERTSPARVDGRTDRISEGGRKPRTDRRTEDGAEVTADEAVGQAEEAAEAMAGLMLAQTAVELNMTEEEVLQVLEELHMTPLDLLNAENLQAVVLQAAGESDSSSFVIDEQLFAAFKNLTSSLEEIVAEVAEATGLETGEVTEIFDRLLNAVKGEGEPQSLPAEQASGTEPEGEVPDIRPADGLSGADGTAQGVEDGTEVMLARSLSENGGREEAQSSFSGETAQNPFAQNLTGNAAADAVQTAQEVRSYFDGETGMILEQITDYMKGQVTDGVSEVEMQLHPESLGSLHIKLTAREGVVTAQFTAQNETVKAALESQMIQLKETFKEQGVAVDAIEVLVESHRFDENLSRNGGQPAHGERQAARQRQRRINLNIPADEEEFSEEEQIAAEMMRDSGNTVDYTA